MMAYSLRLIASSFSLFMATSAWHSMPAQTAGQFGGGSSSLADLARNQPSSVVPGGATNSGMPSVFAPSLPRTAYTRFPWKTDIVTTVFWVGETPTENNPTPNNKSSWDTKWMENYGGFDNPDPAQRTPDFLPKGFTPRLNPFYVALPYNDVLNYKTHKPEASRIIPWFKTSFVKPGRSVLRGTWLAIRYGNQVCYAQWEDCGPFLTDDPDYVFGNARPKNPHNKGAGLDVSPAVRDYLGMPSGAKVDWRFVDVNEIPGGPWTKYGMNNHFVRIKEYRARAEASLAQSREAELRKLRDQRFGSGQ